MADSPTIEELERRLDKLCDEYLKHPHDKYMQREIIDLARRLDELKTVKRKSEPKHRGREDQIVRYLLATNP
jgi:Cdc6-like AAA superfamily ATPase